MEVDRDNANKKKADYQQIIDDSQRELLRLDEIQSQSQDIQLQNAQREDYLKVRSTIEVQNSQINRQIAYLQQTI